jgi:hypothetical protein
MGTAPIHRVPAAPLIDVILGAVARLFCALFRGHEDIRRFDSNARRMYVECVRCLRMTTGCSLGQLHARAADACARGIATGALTPAPHVGVRDQTDLFRLLLRALESARPPSTP